MVFCQQVTGQFFGARETASLESESAWQVGPHPRKCRWRALLNVSICFEQPLWMSILGRGTSEIEAMLIFDTHIVLGATLQAPWPSNTVQTCANVVLKQGQVKWRAELFSPVVFARAWVGNNRSMCSAFSSIVVDVMLQMVSVAARKLGGSTFNLRLYVVLHTSLHFERDVNTDLL